MNALDLQLQSLVKCLSSLKINYAILGGIAVSIYGEPRLTADIDVNIILDKRLISDFMDRARSYGFYPALPQAKQIAEETGVMPIVFRKAKVKGKFDIIIAENPLEYFAIKRAGLKKIGSVKARVVSAEDLIIHKLTSYRPRDLEDIKGILICQGKKLDIEYILYWLKRIDKVDSKSQLCRLFKKLLKEV